MVRFQPRAIQGYTASVAPRTADPLADGQPGEHLYLHGKDEDPSWTHGYDGGIADFRPACN